MTTTEQYKAMKVLITTSGIGSRLGELTDYTNKSLIRVGDKPAISHIIENYPEDTEFVITLGYYAQHVKQYLEIAYPLLSFSFVEVDNYSGAGSSLAYSMLQAKEYLLQPFVFHACDTIVSGRIPYPSNNWCAGGKRIETLGGAQYRSMNISRGQVQKINNKGEMDYDLEYLGICGIYDYQLFWDSLAKLYNFEPLSGQLSDCDAINLMLGEAKFSGVEFYDWYDMGNIDSLKESRKSFSNSFNVLDKPDESIFLVDDHIIKFFHSKEVCQNRIARATRLGNLVPIIVSGSDNFYKYRYVKGHLYADVANCSNFPSFLNWSKENLWRRTVAGADEIVELCDKFYFEKTRKRLDNYLKKAKDKDVETIINGLRVPPVHHMLDCIDKDWLCESEPSEFHGDFILDNIIKTDSGYCLIDWRQDFAGNINFGDIYYDLAKLNHNLILNHENIKNNHFKIESKGDEISCDILVNFSLLESRQIFRKFLIENNFDTKKVDVLTSLVWISMSPLHEYPLNKFLFYFGKYNLYKNIKEELNE